MYTLEVLMSTSRGMEPVASEYKFKHQCWIIIYFISHIYISMSKLLSVALEIIQTVKKVLKSKQIYIKADGRDNY